MHPLLEKKFGKVFDFFDVDDDGYIRRADYEAMADRVAAGHGIPEGSPEHHAFRASMLLVWERLRNVLGIEDDGAISRDAFIEAEDARESFHQNLEPHEYHDTIALFALMDTSQSGFVTLEEYVGALSTAGLPVAESAACFERLDVRGEGQVTLPEMIELWRQFFTSTDPEAPGNVLFGSLD